jgi:hypothetical protein
MKHKTKINSRNERECVIPVRQLTDGDDGTLQFFWVNA